MAQPMRLTSAAGRVLRIFAIEPDGPHYGMDLMARLKMSSYRLYPILARLEVAGIVRTQAEDMTGVTSGRPPRRFYRLTDAGRVYVREYFRLRDAR